MAHPSSAFAAPGRAGFLATLVIAVASVFAAIGCQPATTDSLPILTDPREIVMAGVDSTAALRTVHARIDVRIQGAGQAFGGPEFASGQTVDLDIDLATRNLAGRSVSAIQGASDQTNDIILVDGRQFTRNLPNARWTQSPNFGGQPSFPTNEELVAAVSSVVDGAGVVLQLADPEACSLATCYHVIAELDAISTWKLIGPVLAGAPPNGPPPPGFNLPPITLHLLVEQATRALVGANTAISFQGTSVALTIALSNHDAPLQIVPPNPVLVDQFDVDFGGGMATPMPAESP